MVLRDVVKDLQHFETTILHITARFIGHLSGVLWNSHTTMCQ